MQIEPFGELRADWRNAALISSIYNLVREKGASPFRPIDFASPWLKEWWDIVSGDEPGIAPKAQTVQAFEDLYALHNSVSVQDIARNQARDT